MRDRETDLTTRVSVGHRGAQASGSSADAAISADGRYVAFSSSAADLIAGDTNGTSDVFVHDRTSGVTRRESVTGVEGREAHGSSGGASITADGRRVAFYSNAPDLVPGDGSGFSDIFLRSRAGGSSSLTASRGLSPR